MEPLFSKEIRQDIEALLLSACEPLKLKDIASCAQCSEETALDILE